MIDYCELPKYQQLHSIMQTNILINLIEKMQTEGFGRVKRRVGDEGRIMVGNQHNLFQSMRNQPIFSALSFSISNFQLTCALDGPLLKITVASLRGSQKPITLSKMSTEESSLQLFLSQPLPPSPRNSHDSNSNLHASKSQDSTSLRIEEKLARLEQTVKQLQSKLSSHTESKKSLRKNPSQQGKFSVSNSRKNLNMQPGFGLRENEAVEFGEIIERDVEENAKLELLNDLLQQKILQKEGLIVDLEKQLMDREELIRELAEKLITANMEREEIFGEYEKILQSTVFHQNEDATPKAFKQRSEAPKLEQQVQIQEKPEIQAELPPPAVDPIVPSPPAEEAIEQPLPQEANP